MKFSTADKIWIGGAIMVAVVSLNSAIHHIPRTGSMSSAWTLLAFISSIVVLVAKLHNLNPFDSPVWVHGGIYVMLGLLVIPTMFYFSDTQDSNRTALIEKSNATVDGVVRFTSEIGWGRGSIRRDPRGHRVAYKYTVSGIEYVDVATVSIVTMKKQAYVKGSSVVVRYSTTEPSVSELVGKADVVISGQ